MIFIAIIVLLRWIALHSRFYTPHLPYSLAWKLFLVMINHQLGICGIAVLTADGRGLCYKVQTLEMSENCHNTCCSARVCLADNCIFHRNQSRDSLTPTSDQVYPHKNWCKQPYLQLHMWLATYIHIFEKTWNRMLNSQKVNNRSTQQW